MAEPPSNQTAANPVAIITGALAGIGRATAFAFAAEGYRVVISGRNDEAGYALLEELRISGAECDFVCADVRFESEVADLIDKAVERFGRLDVAGE
jgi:NAD(P)-dependent dehydrogenase (short-subunit alcohol dehydrogenase family)